CNESRGLGDVYKRQILPTTELLFESEQNEKIYRVIEE
ncbi:hypothetical protein ACN6QN_18705, partial [Acinetobacter baumannii]